MNDIYKNVSTTQVPRHEPPHSLHLTKIRKLIHAPIKPETPPHIGAALKCKNVDNWIDCLYAAYDKMHKTGTLSLPFQRHFWILKHQSYDPN